MAMVRWLSRRLREVPDDRVSELRADHEITLTVMGGEETVRVTEAGRTRDRLIRWRGWSPVIGEVGDLLHPEHEVRIAKGRVKHGCAANTCRQPGTGWWVRGQVRVSLCERHGRIYKSLGYTPVRPLRRTVKDAEVAA